MDGAHAYALLGVTESASPEVVTRAFRAAAKRCHPDHGGDRREFEALWQAYCVIRSLPTPAPARSNPFMTFAAVAPVVRFDAYDSRPRRVTAQVMSFEEELRAAMNRRSTSLPTFANAAA